MSKAIHINVRFQAKPGKQAGLPGVWSSCAQMSKLWEGRAS